MRKAKIGVSLAAVFTLLMGSFAAYAQLPPHPMGSICITPRFWCWSNPPGAQGTACVCPSPYGNVPGTRG